MLRLLLLCCFLIPASLVFSQGMIGYTLKATRKSLEKYVQEHHFTNSPIREEGNVISIQVKDSTVSPVAFYYFFDDAGKCHTEQKVTSCEVCYKNLMDNILGQKKYNWVKLSDSMYVSSFSKKRSLVLHTEGAYNYIDLTKITWTREEYEKLLTVKKM